MEDACVRVLAAGVRGISHGLAGKKAGFDPRKRGTARLGNRMRNDNNAGDRNARVGGEPKIFIGQIPMECTQDDVLNLFRRFGTVKSASLMTHMDGRSKGCAMVLYEKWAEAEAAMDACNGNAILGGERALVVNFADPPKRGGGVPPIAPKTLFVGQVSCAKPLSEYCAVL